MCIHLMRCEIPNQMENVMKQEITTTNLSDFGSRERWMLVELLTEWDKNGLPDEFYEEDVTPMMNRNSGYVFLTNSEFQCAMMNDGKLEIWHHCGNCGHEGFKEDCQLTDEGCNECDSKTG